MNQPVLKNLILSMNLLVETMAMRPSPFEKAETLLKHICLTSIGKRLKGKPVGSA